MKEKDREVDGEAEAEYIFAYLDSDEKLEK
jgi:hypothetical protein